MPQCLPMTVGVCLSDERVLAFLAGELSGGALAAVEEHLDGCARCRAVVAGMADTSRPSRGGARREVGATFAVGETLAGRYRIVRFIAQGGMGEVYEAADLALDEHVALKTVSAAISDNAELIARLKREVQLA